jgi:hypothetical protein
MQAQFHELAAEDEANFLKALLLGGVFFIGVSQAVVPMIASLGSRSPEAFECGENHRF